MGEDSMPWAVTTVGLKEMSQRISQLTGIQGRFVRGNMRVLGGRIQWIMRQSLREHRYTGQLEESVQYEASDTGVEIGPTKKYRGGYDAGRILSTGTRPIPNLPFRPIKKWAEFRGLPAGSVWIKIKQQGISPHPWLEKVMMRGDLRVALENTAKRLGMTLTAYALIGDAAAQQEIARSDFGG